MATNIPVDELLTEWEKAKGRVKFDHVAPIKAIKYYPDGSVKLVEYQDYPALKDSE